MDNELCYGKPVTVTPTKEQRKKIEQLKGTEYILAHDIRNNYLDTILDNAIEKYCVRKE